MNQSSVNSSFYMHCCLHWEQNWTKKSYLGEVMEGWTWKLNQVGSFLSAEIIWGVQPSLGCMQCYSHSATWSTVGSIKKKHVWYTPTHEGDCFQSVHLGATSALTALTVHRHLVISVYTPCTFTDFCANLLHNWPQPGADWDGPSAILNTPKSCVESCCVTKL